MIRPNEHVRVKAQFKFTVDEATEQLHRGLDRLLDKRGLGFMLLLRAAISESLLEAYRQRFGAAREVMKDMRKSDVQSNSRAQRERRLFNRQQRLTTRREQALRRANGDPERQAKITARYGRMQAKLTAAYEKFRKHEDDNANDATNKLDTGGLFTKRMGQIYDLLSVKGLTPIQGGFALGPTLQKIETPSFTEHRLDGKPAHPTSSRHTVMWRQLEFGTGGFARPDVRQGGSPYKVGAEWWYGTVHPNGAQGIRLAGSRGGHFLRSATGLAYDTDAIRFDYILGEKLHLALLGL